MEVFKRFSGNPILKPLRGSPWESRRVFNCAAFYERGRIHLVYRAQGEDDISRLGYASTSDGFLRIEVKDTGCGISQENMRKLFTPFFTTKGKGKGVGLGLAVAHGIIQRHQVRREVQSKEGEGTTFTIKLPLNAN